MRHELDFEEECKNNRFKPGSAKHWLIFFVNKHNRTPRPREVTTRFTVVEFNTDQWSYAETQKRYDALLEAAKETCDFNHYAIVDYCAFFTKENDAMVFKLKVSELLA